MKHLSRIKNVNTITIKAVQISLTKSKYKIQFQLFVNAQKICDVEIVREREKKQMS